MDLTKLFPGTKWDDAYTIETPIGQGSMAYIYKASVDLSKFDFAHLIAYWEAQKENVAFDNLDAYCKYRKEVWNSHPAEELRHHCEMNNICFPEQQVCAMKILKENKHTERFLTEWQKTIGIYHPHLLQVYGGGNFQGCFYYTMELITNPYDLKKLYDISMNSKVQLMVQAAKGLGSLHSMDIVHRDVKVDNFIVFQNNGELHLKIADLGIAKNKEANYTQTNQVLGTPNFMAPEQVKNSKSVNHLCDIYSLGATFYELVCGKPPYAGQSLQTMLQNINDGNAPIPIDKVCPDVSPEISRIIKYLMAFKPSGRPQNMEEVQELFKNYLDGNYAHTPKKKTEKVSKRPRRVAANIPRKRRVEAYKKSANDEKKAKIEMYLKLFVILLGPALLILYLLFPELITATQENRGMRKKKVIRDVYKRSTIKKKEPTLKERLRNANKRNFAQFFLQESKGKWKKADGRNSWKGFTAPESKNQAILKVNNFPQWQNYEIVFFTKIISGSLTLKFTELKEKIVLTDIFDDMKKYPLLEFRIVITLVGKDMLIERFLSSGSGSVVAPTELRKIRSEIKSIVRLKNKKPNLEFIVQSSGRFPGHVTIDQSRIHEVE